MPYEVITFGETLLRLTPPHLQQIEQMHALEVHIGGSESNVAVGLARLGLRVAWLSRMTDNALGQLVVGALRAHTVDVSNVIWTPHDRVGLYFLEEGKAPRGSRVIYDRAHSAMSHIQPTDISPTLFEGGTGVLHLSGITPALSASAAATTQHIARLAASAGWRICFDLNYREKLWKPTQAVAYYDKIAPLADWILLPLRDAIRLYETPAPPADALAALHARYPRATLVLTLGAEGSIALTPDGTLMQQAAFTADAVGRVGGGDAFAAGFLYGVLTFDDVSTALRWGNAAAAHKYSTVGDIPLFRRADLERILNTSISWDLQR